MDEQATISIASTGLEASHIRILEFLISYYFEDEFSLSTQKSAEVHIINLNNAKNIIETFASYKKKSPNTLFILISDKTIEDNNSQTIDFPVSPRKLFDALKVILDKLKYSSSENKKSKVKLKKVKSKKSSSTKNKVYKRKDKQKNKKKVLDKTNKAKSQEAKNSYKVKKSGNSKATPKFDKIKKIKAISTRKQAKKPKKAKLSVKASNHEKLKLIYKAEKNPAASSPPQKDAEVLSEREYDFYTDLDDCIENSALDYLNNDKKKNSISTDNNPVSHTYVDSSALEKDKSIAISEDKLTFMSSRPDIDINNDILISRISYKAGEYLQGRLNNIFRSPRFNSLNTSYGIITYNTKNHMACVNVDDRTLQSISSVAKLRMEYSLVNLKKMLEDESLVWEDADAVLWKVSIWASRGRLPLIYNDIDKKFSLKYWPNLTRFMMTPHSMEIAALWTKEPTSLRKTLELLDIKQRYVFSFYSAAIALDLITFETEDRKNIQVMSGNEYLSGQRRVKKKGVFSKLLKYFKPNNIEEI